MSEDETMAEMAEAHLPAATETLSLIDRLEWSQQPHGNTKPRRDTTPTGHRPVSLERALGHSRRPDPVSARFHPLL